MKTFHFRKLFARSSGRTETLDSILKVESRTLIDRTQTTGQPPSKEELDRLEGFQKLKAIQEKTRSRYDHWFILTGSITIALVVCYLAFMPYPYVRLLVTAKAREVVFSVYYLQVLSNPDIRELRLHDVGLLIDDSTEPLTGELSVSGETLKAGFYRHQKGPPFKTGTRGSVESAYGPLQLRYDRKQRVHLLTVRGPDKDDRIVIDAPGASVSTIDAAPHEVTKVKSRVTILGLGKMFNGTIDAVLSRRDDKFSPTTILSEEDIEGVRFENNVRFLDTLATPVSPGSSILSGKVEFLNFPGKSYTLRPTERLAIDSIFGTGRLRSLELIPEAIQITFNVAAKDVAVGESEDLVRVTPTYLEYVQSRRSFTAVYAVIASLISVLIGVVGFLLRRST